MLFIEEKNCISCGACRAECEFDAVILKKDDKYLILNEKCTDCGACIEVCPVECIKEKDELA